MARIFANLILSLNMDSFQTLSRVCRSQSFLIVFIDHHWVLLGVNQMKDFGLGPLHSIYMKNKISRKDIIGIKKVCIFFHFCSSSCIDSMKLRSSMFHEHIVFLLCFCCWIHVFRLLENYNENRKHRSMGTLTKN